MTALPWVQVVSSACLDSILYFSILFALSHITPHHTHTYKHTHCQYRLPDESKEGRDILNEMPTEAERSSVVEIIPKGLGRYVTPIIRLMVDFPHFLSFLFLPFSHSVFSLFTSSSLFFFSLLAFLHEIFVTGSAYCVRHWATYTSNYSLQSAPELSRTSQ